MITFADFYNLSTISVSMQSLTLETSNIVVTSSDRWLIGGYRGLQGTYTDATMTIRNNTLSLTTSEPGSSFSASAVAVIFLEGHDSTIEGNTITLVTTDDNSAKWITANGIYAYENNSGPFELTVKDNTINVTGPYAKTIEATGIRFDDSEVSGTIENNEIASVQCPGDIYGIFSSAASTFSGNEISITANYGSSS